MMYLNDQLWWINKLTVSFAFSENFSGRFSVSLKYADAHRTSPVRNILALEKKMSIPINARSPVWREHLTIVWSRDDRFRQARSAGRNEARSAYWRYRNCGIFRGSANRFSIIARHRAPPSAIAKAIEGKMLDRMFASGNSWHQLIAHQTA